VVPISVIIVSSHWITFMLSANITNF
jgi:hypothetical protein